MQLTIDSQENLNRVLQVVGSLYGVELAVTGRETRPKSVRRSATRGSASGSTVTGTLEMGLTGPDGTAAAAPEGAGRGRSRRGRSGRKAAIAAATSRTPGRTASRTRGRTAPTLDVTAVRDWARQNGYAISDRGRVSNAILAAYRDSAPTPAAS